MDFTIEELTMNAWPSLQTILLDGWIIRMADGYTKRSNSVNPIYNFENNLDKKINYCENIYRSNNLPIVFKIIDCKEHKIIDKKLEKLNYDKIDLTSVQIYNKIEQINSKSVNIIIDDKFTEDWKSCFYQCNNIENLETKKTIENMLKNIRHKIISVYKVENKIFVGCGYGVIENGYIGLFDIIVKDEFRGNGYGKEIVKTILARAKENGINKAYLAVVNNNSTAKNLYKNIGFKEIYKYWYRKKD
jgi:N-acetylglutamate synthase-like GNAT family acetyltransferase